MTHWRWITISGLDLTLTLDSDDPDAIALVEQSAADNRITLERLDDGGAGVREPVAPAPESPGDRIALEDES